MAQVANISKEGDFSIISEVDSRLPSVNSELTAYFPFDGKGGTVDVVQGYTNTQGTASKVNILESLSKSWTDPSNWTGSPYWDFNEQALVFPNSGTVLSNPIPIDTSKHWFLEATMKESIGSTGGMYLGTISYDANMNQLTGHPGSYDYFGNVGSACPTTWTIYNNNIIGGINGNGRTGENTNAGDYASWHTGTKFARIMILPNYSGSGKTYVKDLKFYYSDADTSNTIITNKGISIEEGTTNYVVSPLDPSGGWQGRTSTIIPYYNLPLGKGYEDLPENAKGYKMDKTCNANTWSGNAYSYTNVRNHPCVINVKYSISVWCFVSSDFNGTWAMLECEGSSSGSINYDMSKKGTWQKLTMTNTATATGTFPTHLYWCKGGVTDFSTLEGYVIYLAPQIEEKAYVTSFVNGSKGMAQINILTNIGVKDFTIVGEFIPNQNSDLLPDGSYFLNLGGGFIISTYQQVPYLAGNTIAGAGGHNVHLDYNTTPNSKVTYIIQRSGTTFSWRMIDTNGQDVTWIKTHTNVPLISISTLVFYGSWGGKHKNLSIYNKVLSSTEISEMLKSRFHLNKMGSLLNEIIERPYGIPLDAYYYPLGLDTKDEYKNYSSSTANNLAYEEGSVWVGSSSTNLLQPLEPSWGVWGGFTGSSTNFLAPDGTNGVHLSALTSGGCRWYGPGNRFNASGSSLYMVTAIVKYTVEPSVNLFYIRQYRADNTQISEFGIFSPSGKVSLGNGWYRVSKTFTSSSECTTFSVEGYEYGVTDVYMYNIQCEQKSFPTPYVNGTRSTSYIAFNFNSSIGLSWAGDWSIVYWKKPVATHSNNLTGYNIESLGCNGNSTGGGYTWWGKTDGVDTINSSNPLGFTPSKFFNKWRMVSLVKSGTTVIVKEWSQEAVHIRTISTTNTVSNYYVTQYGYDFKMSGWDNGNSCNSYFRDLIVTKRALTDIEVSNLYKNMLTDNKLGDVYIQNQLMEGDVF